jgi:hypothetical protein
LSTRYIDGFRARLSALHADAPLTETFGVRWALAQALLRTGELDEAAGLCRQCVALCDKNPDQAAGWLPEVLLRLGAIYFRQAEKQNCIARHNAESCILPLSPRAVHVDKEGATAAVEVLTRLLALPQSDLRLEAMWLLNIAHMALGDWPDGVPASTGSARACSRPKSSSRACTNAAPGSGLGHHHHAGSVAIDDYHGRRAPRHRHVFVRHGPRAAPVRAEPDGRFLDIATAAGLGRQLGGVNVVHGDVDNDGGSTCCCCAAAASSAARLAVQTCCARTRRATSWTLRQTPGSSSRRRRAALPSPTSTATATSICSSPARANATNAAPCNTKPAVRQRRHG